METQLAHTIAEASARSGIGRTVLYHLINSGRLPARKLGRKTLIMDDDLRRCLRSLPKVSISDAPERESRALARRKEIA